MNNQKVLLVLEIDPFKILTQRPNHLINYLKNKFSEVQIIYVDYKLFLDKYFRFDDNYAREYTRYQRIDNVTYIGVPSSRYYEPAKRFILDRELLKYFITALFKGIKFDICLLAHPLSAPLLSSIKKNNIADKVVYEDLDDFVSYYEHHEPHLKECIVKFEDYIIHRVDAVFSVSESLREYRLSQGHSKNTCFVSHNGVNSNFFLPVHQNIKRDNLIYMGSLEKWAGVQLAIKGFSKLLDLGIDTNLLIAGEGTYEPNLRKLVKKLGLEQKVIFLGRVKHIELPELLAKTKLGIITFERSSLTALAHPIKLVEYLASGLVIVGSNFGEIKRAIKESGAGVAVKNDTEFANKVKELFINDQLYREYQKNAQKYAHDYEWEKLFDKEFDIISTIATKRSQPELKYAKKRIINKLIAVFAQNEFPLDKLFANLEQEWLASGFHNVAIYGAGEHTEKLLRYLKFSHLKIIGLVDSNYQLHGTKKFDFPIMCMDEAIEKGIEAVIISSQRFEDDIYSMIKNVCQKKKIAIYPLYKKNKNYHDHIWRQLYVD